MCCNYFGGFFEEMGLQKATSGDSQVLKGLSQGWVQSTYIVRLALRDLYERKTWQKGWISPFHSASVKMWFNKKQVMATILAPHIDAFFSIFKSKRRSVTSFPVPNASWLPSPFAAIWADYEHSSTSTIPEITKGIPWNYIATGTHKCTNGSPHAGCI